MTTYETVQEYSLPMRLMIELDFHTDMQSMEWVYSDEMTDISGINGPEFLPCRTRVSFDGSRLEFGVRKVDLSKTLELARLGGKDAKDLDHVRGFWPEGSRISINEDEEWLFMGAAIEPTAEDFEREFTRIESGLDVAISGALEGKTYEEMKADSWYDAWVESAETRSVDRGGSEIFPRKPAAELEEMEEGSACRDWWDRSAENLRSYKIETWEKFVGNAATELRIGDRVFIGAGIGHLDAHNGADVVTIHDSGYMTDNADGSEKQGKRWNLSLPIPEGVEVKTVSDIAQLKQATLELQAEEANRRQGEPTRRELNVNVSVEDHRVTVESEDGEYGITFYEPACMRCEIPIWKFKWPEGVEGEGNASKAHSGIGLGGDIIMSGGSASSNGVYYYSVGSYEYGKRSTRYCHDCFCDVQDEFADQYPLARRENALAAMRAKLDEIGYSDVQLMPDQVWPSWHGEDDEMEMFAYIEYERGGRKIMRRAGRPLIKYSGEITFPDLPSREYIEFR